jgi:rare lipoprotein A
MTPPRRPKSAVILIIFALIGGSFNLGAWEQTGIASWYGGIFQGRKTANGETYDTWAYTCAHRTLPFGTILEVVNLNNNRRVRVRVNDRGPFVDDRIIDLTYAAARDLDMVRDGTAPVLIRADESAIPEMRFNIQIGAWGDLENALTHRIRLTDAGMAPRAELGSDGITRIFLPDVAESDVFGLAQKLESLGYNSLFVYQTTRRVGSPD